MKNTTIFLHIPKTGGNTLSQILRRLYNSEHTRSIYSLKDLDTFLNAPLEDRSTVELLEGHFSYGIHDYLPRPSSYITMLRDPVERILSLYYYILREPANYLHRTVVDQQMSLEAFVNSNLTIEVTNFQTRALAGMTLDPDSTQVVGEEALMLAQRRLRENFAVAGVLDKFDESLVLLSDHFGWNLSDSKLSYTKGNVSHGRPTRHDISDHIYRAILKTNELDYELYRYATSLFAVHTRLKFWRMVPYRAQQFRKLNEARQVTSRRDG
ncbi:MAG: hypothetical protein CL610_07560 [Anaerolineaceae bacterium]|nr:hypothetical protein [Anaerolineaceae bacterium]